MPNKSLKATLPIAFVIVVVLALLAAANPSIWFRLADPAGTAERRRTQKLHAIASADKPLTADEARNLLARARAGHHAAGIALVGQDRKHGLPAAFFDELQRALAETAGQDVALAGLVEQLAAHRPFGDETERILAGAVAPAGAADRTQPIAALGQIGVHRALAPATLDALLDVAASRATVAATALAAIEKTAARHGLPDAAIDRLEAIATERRGTLRNDAIRVLGAAGARDRALVLLNARPGHGIDPAVVAQVLRGDNLAQLDALLHDPAMTAEVRVGALERIVRRRDASEQVGAALVYAFTNAESSLRRAAFAGFPEWGRHHSPHIALAWDEVVARAFDDADDRLRMHAVDALRFIPFDDATARERFRLRMLAGSATQQRTVLAALAWDQPWSEPVRDAALALVGSADAEVAAAALTLAQRLQPVATSTQRRNQFAGTLFWGLVFLPAATAIAFETFFVARLLQAIAARRRRRAPLVVSLVWFALSLALGLGLGTMVLGLHGNAAMRDLLVALAVVNLVFAGVGASLSLVVRRAPDGADKLAA